jgi:hypothetical protein
MKMALDGKTMINAIYFRNKINQNLGFLESGQGLLVQILKSRGTH